MGGAPNTISMASIRSTKTSPLPSAHHPQSLHAQAHHDPKPPSPPTLTIFTLLLCLGSFITLLTFWASYNYALHYNVGSSAAMKGSSSLGGEKKRFKYLYWGEGIDCPGKHCTNCGGLGHQESSLRCALEEALELNRTFVLPSSVCITAMHNKKGVMSRNHIDLGNQSWAQSTCSVEALYDLELMSKKVRVIMDNSREWTMRLFGEHVANTIVQVEGVSRTQLRHEASYRNALVIKRKANPLAWFVECKDRRNRSSVLLPYSFLPSMAAKPLRIVANKIKAILGDYDAIHVRRGDILKIRKDRFGQPRTLFPHLDRDTQPEAIMHRIAQWIPAGRTLFIASNEQQPGFFYPLFSRYKVFRSSNFTVILTNVVQNNYQLFMIERLILAGAKTLVKTFKEFPTDLSLTDDIKRGNHRWEIPIYSFDNSTTHTI